MKKALLTCLFAIVVLGHSGWATPSDSASWENIAVIEPAQTDQVSKFIVTTWRSGEGLPVNNIQELIETPDGYLWMGTYRGLVRFDGIRFQSFFATPTGARYGARMGALEVDSRGRLWSAPDQFGVVCLDRGVFREALTNESILKHRVQSLCNGGDGSMLWVDAGGGLGRFVTDAPEYFEKLKQRAPAGSRWMRDFDGVVWLVAPRALKVLEEDRLREIFSSDLPLVAAPRRGGGLWLSKDGKLWKASAEGTMSLEVEFPWKGQTRVNCFLEDKQGRLWVGTVAQGLFCYMGGEFQRVVPTASSIASLIEDKHQNIWAGTRGGGLIRIRERQFFRVGTHHGMQNEFVRSLAQDRGGRVWVLSADGGLGWMEKGAWRELGEEDGWPGFDSSCLLPMNDGSVLISTHEKGLWRWAGGKFHRFRLVPRNPSEAPTDLLEDRRGRLWMVTDNSGIYCARGNRLTSYNTEQGLPSRHMRRILETESGDILAADWEGGVVRFMEGKWELVRPSSGHQDAVRSMVSVGDTLLIGTSAGGLLHFKNGKTVRISVDQGLPDVCIEQLMLDAEGSLWGGTPHTLFRISLNQLEAVVAGREQQVTAITYGRNDGLPDVSFASWCDPRNWLASDGEMWFATANGAIHFHPENLHQTMPPQAIIEQTLFEGKPITEKALQYLRLGTGRLEFRFTAPCLTAPERVRFRYQMQGVDKEWVDAGTARTATYTGIPAGTHVFRVIASSPDGVWGERAATISVSVHPYFWQSTWFLAAIAAVTAGGGVWTMRWAAVRRLRRRLERLRAERAIDQERARIAQDIHDELGANLTSIGLMADMGVRHKADSAVVKRELDQISETARESVAAMDAIVWALNPRNDSLDSFANYISHFTRDFFRPTGLRTRLEIPTDLPTQSLASAIRHQLFLLVKESFNNIARHAQATEVQIKLSCEDGRLCISIGDNGKGLSRATMREGGNGLSNLRERIERLGGSLVIETKEGQGTRLQFNLALSKLKAG